MRNNYQLFILFFLYLNLSFLSTVPKFELPKIKIPEINGERISHYGEELGKAAGKGLAETVTQFLKPAKKKYESPYAEPQEDFIRTIFAGKKAEIPLREIDAVRTVKLNKALFNTTALMAAIVADRVDMVEYLLENDADPNVQNKDGITALHLAARAGKKVMVKKLLAYGADPNIQDKHKMTPLMYAVMRNVDDDHYDVIKVLLHHNADPNLVNNKGRTALMMAVINNDYDVVKILLRHHSRPAIKDYQGKIAFDFAQDKKLKDLLLLSELSFRPLSKDIEEDEMFPVFGGPQSVDLEE